MNILTSWTFWVILGAIILIMALIGYLAEGTDFAKKALTKEPKKEKLKKEKTKKENIISAAPIPEQTALPIETAEDNFVVSVDKPVEVLNVGDEITPDSWDAVIPKVDTTFEKVHNEPSLNDWSTIPSSLPEVQLDNLETPEENVFPEVKQNDLDIAVEPVELPADIFEQAPAELGPQEQINDDVWKV